MLYDLLATGGVWQVFTGYCAWYRPGFHPNDLDTRALLDGWKRELTQSDQAAPSASTN